MGIVSIIIPVYNLEKKIRRCLDSVLKQSYRAIEVILIDDGSSDQSVSICTEYLQIDSRIKLIQSPHGGVSNARNRGIAAATGEYILFVDGDDQIAPDMVETYVSSFEQKTDIVIGGITVLEEGRIREIIHPEAGIYTRKQLLNQICVNENGQFGFVAGKMYRREWLLAHQICFPEHMAAQEDLSFAISAYAAANYVRCIEFCGYYYHRNPERRNVPVEDLLMNQMRLCDLVNQENVEPDRIIRRIHKMVYAATLNVASQKSLEKLMNTPNIEYYLRLRKPISRKIRFVIDNLLTKRFFLLFCYYKTRNQIKIILGSKNNND